jgi:predicted metal-dependent phosphoesterase TrpH
MIEESSAYDFHIHSMYSFDSITHPKTIIAMAEKRKLTGIAITDHNTIKGSLMALQEKSNIQIIPGSEIKTPEGEIIALFIHEEIQSRDFLGIVHEVHDQGGLVVLPHPYKGRESIPPYIVSSVDIVEIFNGRRSHEKNIRADKLAKECNKPAIGGSDSHCSFEIGRVRTVFQRKIDDMDQLKKAILTDRPSIIGIESPHYVHYPSVLIGSIKTNNYKRLFASVKRILYK